MPKSEKPSKPTLVTTKARQAAPLITPTDFKTAATTDISAAMNGILADVFALYLKTKNFHWHMSGPHFRDYHVMLDEQADQIYAMADPIAERIRKLGGATSGAESSELGLNAPRKNLNRSLPLPPSSVSAPL